MPAELMPWAIIWNMAPLTPIRQAWELYRLPAVTVHTPMPSST